MLLKVAMIAILPAVLAVGGVNLAMAQTDAKTGADAKTSMDAKTSTALAKKKIADVTCEDFNGLATSFQPTVVAWAEGFRQGATKPSDVVIDVDGIERVTPVVAEACQKDPSASFWSKAEAELKKIF